MLRLKEGGVVALGAQRSAQAPQGVALAAPCRQVGLRKRRQARQPGGEFLEGTTSVGTAVEGKALLQQGVKERRDRVAPFGVIIGDQLLSDTFEHQIDQVGPVSRVVGQEAVGLGAEVDR